MAVRTQTTFIMYNDNIFAFIHLILTHHLHYYYFFILYFHIIIQKKQSMGCSDSHLKDPSQNQNDQPQKPRVIRFAPSVQDDTQIPKEDNKLKKAVFSKSKSRSKGKSQHQANDKSIQVSSVDQKEEKLKVKKARLLRHKPEHDKFIEDIMTQSRAKLTSQFPEIPKSNSGFIKPVIEYPNNAKGQILPNQSKLKEKSKWSKAICDDLAVNDHQVEYNNSYIGINENVKSPYKKKQIEKRLNEIRNGRFEDSQSGKLARQKYGHHYDSFSQPLYL